jgi:hypothetical protein
MRQPAARSYDGGMPLVSPRAMVFEKEIGTRTREQLAAAQLDHDRLIAAIDARQGQRASEIMRDHAIKSGDAKRKNVDGILTPRRPWRCAAKTRYQAECGQRHST